MTDDNNDITSVGIRS